MSYNGIGLASVRGTATSGHVQGNRSYVKPSRVRLATERNAEAGSRDRDQMKLLKAKLGTNDDIIEHQMLRQVEMQLLEFREHLERRKVGKKMKKGERKDDRKDDIDQQVEKERMRLRER